MMNKEEIIQVNNTDREKIIYGILKDVEFRVKSTDKDSILAIFANLKGYYEVRNVSDSRFHAFIRERYRSIAQEDDVISYRHILEVYTDKALLENKKIDVLSRLGGDENETSYFMADDKNSVLLINASGIKIIKVPKKYYFMQRDNTAEQVMPKSRKPRKGLIEELKPYLNMDTQMQILFVIMLVQNFICSSSHFAYIFSSKQGSGKSTLTNIIRRIIDPAVAVMASMPENADSLKNHLANNLVVCFDNTQPLNNTYSDILCGAVTGTSFVKRKLYTDNDEVIMKLHNIIILNGIDIIPRKSDLLERSVLFKLNNIPNRKRKSEAEIKAEFEEDLPYIFGEVLKTLKKYFQKKDSIKVVGDHRMSGAYRDCYIIATILGVENEFLEAFSANQKLLQADYEETNPIISAITSFMDGCNVISDSVSALYLGIKRYADKLKFPKSPSAFSRMLREQQTELLKAGFVIAFSEKHDFTMLTITRNKRKL